MTRRAFIVGATAALLVAQDPIAEIRMGTRGVRTTVEGNLIDLDCYVEHGGFGPDHLRCSRVCNEKGLLVALLDGEGNVYVIQGRVHQPLQAVNQPLREHMESTVVIQGELLRRGNMRVLVVDKISRAVKQASWGDIRNIYERSGAAQK